MFWCGAKWNEESLLYFMDPYLLTAIPLALQVKQPQIENIWEKIAEISKKENLNLPHTSNYLHYICNYLYSIYVVLDIII